MNTKVSYLYRDAGNYKVHNECIVEGALSREEIRVILDCCDSGELFIPSQVGLPEARFAEFDPWVDHCWFEIGEGGFESTELPADVPLTAQQLVQNFVARSGAWDDTVWPGA